MIQLQHKLQHKGIFDVACIIKSNLFLSPQKKTVFSVGELIGNNHAPLKILRVTMMRERYLEASWSCSIYEMKEDIKKHNLHHTYSLE